MRWGWDKVEKENKESGDKLQDIWVIDYSFYIYNGSYAFKRPCSNLPTKWAKECIPDCPKCDGTGKIYMQSRDGHVTGGIYSILRQAIEKAQEGFKIITVFDPPKADLTRMKLLDTYKGGRPPVPEWITFQMDWGQKLLPLTGIDCYYSHHDESDDTMAALCVDYANKGHYVVCSSDDKDMFPLLGHQNIDLYRQRELFTVDSFHSHLKRKEKIDIENPSRFNEFLAICGDSADNFNLMGGLGPKAAEFIIKNYDSCLDIFDNLDSMPTKYQKKLVHCSKPAPGDGEKAIKCPTKTCSKCEFFSGNKKKDLELSLQIATLVIDAKYHSVNKSQDKEEVRKMLKSLDLNWAVERIDSLF